MARGMMMLHQTVGIDLIYSFVIIFASLLIYHSTKELYELSNHKGIKYFRYAFLFFSLAYAFRFITQWLFITFRLPRTLNLHPQAIGLLALALFLYASTAAIFYLWASVHWKKIQKSKVAMPLLHILAVAITLFSIIYQHLLILLVTQAIIVVILAITTYKTDRKKKHSQRTYLLYILLAVFWMLNILDLIVPSALSSLQLLIYLASLSIFLAMLYKVVKKTGN
ncbi:MAG: hypothetical protein ABIH92_04920 [Nanoarchaeota archaeon]